MQEIRVCVLEIVILLHRPEANAAVSMIEPLRWSSAFLSHSTRTKLNLIRCFVTRDHRTVVRVTCVDSQ